MTDDGLSVPHYTPCQKLLLSFQKNSQNCAIIYLFFSHFLISKPQWWHKKNRKQRPGSSFEPFVCFFFVLLLFFSLFKLSGRICPSFRFSLPPHCFLITLPKSVAAPGDWTDVSAWLADCMSTRPDRNQTETSQSHIDIMKEKFCLCFFDLFWYFSTDEVFSLLPKWTC